ncbi:SOS-response transcriptional repressor [Vibrio cholerae]|nr:SOS-response transcriptional repressor [Vibrio cholerae]EGR4062394.1 SOS-response transcriptional repressor [Vibrio cholerae]EGR4279207.1 SOS-response transcriptional repressor [Vibrio cholerae]EGR4421280.1 SOS-response transcriptional repressor [Vibrio cholerae]EGR4432088.1 SOS-response transcriptional repressor [Vibrio cholerae]
MVGSHTVFEAIMENAIQWLTSQSYKKQAIGFAILIALDILTVNCIKRQVTHEAVNPSPTRSV